MRNRRFSRWIMAMFILAQLTVINKSLAGVEPEVKQLLPRTGVTFAVGNTATVFDAVLLTSTGVPTAVPPSSYKLYKAQNRVVLDIDQTKINHRFLTQFSVTVNLEINSKNEYGVANPVQYVSLTIDYDTATLFRYTEKNSFTFSGAYWVETKILSVSNAAAIPYIRLNNTLLLERYKNLSATLPVFNTGSILNVSGDIEVSWNAISGAEEYDLEWVFIDDYGSPVIYGGYYPGPFLQPFNMDYDFKNNATRVTIKGTSYKVPMVAEHGYLLFRVRAVGYTGALFTHRVEGEWSSKNYDPKIYNASGNNFQWGKDLFHFVHNPSSVGDVAVHEMSLNWQYQTVFAEEGKSKSVIGYYDGALKNRQNVTRISTDEMAIAAEDIYDYQGRKTGSFLPAPTFENKLRYYYNFNLSATTGNPYGESDFDLSTTYCNRSIGLASTSSGAGKYYSFNNPNKGNMHDEYLPDAQGFPFVLSEYMPDGTGRVRRQSGVGPDHKLGSGHETKYYYGTPDAEELDRLFGNSVGHAKHYQKNMVIDPNGQVSVSYLDLQGRVIATALAGENPSNVQVLPNAGSPDRLNVSVKINPQSDVFENRIETSKTLVVAQPGTYNVDYSITVPRLTDNSTPNWCYDCVYQLEVKLIDECGNNVLDGDIAMAGVQTLVRTIGKPAGSAYDVNCESGGMSYNFTNDNLLNNIPVSMTLQTGTYSLVKTLKVDEEALEYYTQQYITGNSGLRTLQSFKEEYTASADFGKCDLTCAECTTMLGTWPVYLSNRLQSLINLGATPNAIDSNTILESWKALKEHCDALCTEPSVNRCDNLLTLLKADVMPGGQYAPMQEDGTYAGILTADPATVSSLGFNYRYQWVATGNVADKQPVTYLDASNQPILVYINGEAKTPGELTPEEFADFFQESWAETLVKYHPEYCKYQACVTNATAEQYEENMLKTATYSQALAAGYMNPVGESSAPCAANNLDPWFQSGGAGVSKLTDMKNLLKEYQNLDPNDGNCTKLSLWQLCQAYFVCGKKECGAINSCLSITPWNSVTCQPYLDQMWRMFRAVYLAERRKMMESLLSSGCSRTAAMTGKTERVPKLSSFTGGYSNSNYTSIKYEEKLRLLSECDTACMSKAVIWYAQFKGCNLSATDSAELISNFIKVCRNACDENHPYGASSYPKSITQRVTTPYYSFRDVYNKMVSQNKIVPVPGKCDINLITEMPYEHSFSGKFLPPGDTPCIDDNSYKFSDNFSSVVWGTQWSYSSSGSGTTPTATAGVVTIPIGTGNLSLIRWSGSNIINPANGALSYEWVIKTPSVVPGGAEDWWTPIGLLDNNFYGANMMAFYGAGSTWGFILQKNWVNQVKNTGISYSPSTWYSLKMDMNEAQTSCMLTIKNIGTGSTGTYSFTPSITWSKGSYNMVPQAMFEKWGGSTNIDIKADAFNLKQLKPGAKDMSCMEKAPSYDLKRAYYKLNPPEDSTLCKKCIKCGELKDALTQIQGEYVTVLPDSNMNWRKVISNRLNELLNFNLDWMDYWQFMKECSDLDSSYTQSVLNYFMMHYAGVNIPERMQRYNQLHRIEYVAKPIPAGPILLASLTSTAATVPTADSSLLSTCICNKIADYKNTWLGITGPKLPFNEWMSGQCGLSGDVFDYESMLTVCKDMYNLRGKNLTLTGSSTWTTPQKNTFKNLALRKKLYVPKPSSGSCFADCPEDDPTKDNPFFSPNLPQLKPTPNTGGGSGNGSEGGNNAPFTKPKVRLGVTCDSFFYILDSMQTTSAGYGLNFRNIIRLYLFTRNPASINDNISAFTQIKNAFYAKYPLAFNDTRFSNPLQSFLAWLQMYNDCLMDQLGYDAGAGNCCYKPNRYANALTIMLNKLSEAVDIYGNHLVENDWAMNPSIPEYYSSVLYNGTHATNIRFYQNPYDMPTLKMEYDDLNGNKKTVQLNYTTNLFNEAYYGDIVAFFGVQPIRLGTKCDTGHYFKVKVVQKVSWGYDTAILTGYAPNWNLLDTCDKTKQIELCDRDAWQMPWIKDTLTCAKRIAMMVDYYAQKAYEQYLKNVKNDFRKRYLAKCLDPLLTESFTIDKPVYEYHYTLYYYDQAGNLLQTVPPAGVHPLANSVLTSVQTARVNNTTGVFPSHDMNTRYRYNTLNQLIWQQTPDAGIAQFWYDNVGRLVVSQNAKQATNNHYSYTGFDAQGRITEVGQLENPTGGPMTWTIAFTPSQLSTFIGSGSHKQVTKTYYDLSTPGFSYMTQDNLRKRVSGMEYFDDATLSKQSGVYYTYDIHGNATAIARYNKPMETAGQGYSRVDYNFDLVSGKVNRVDYQKNKADQFIHKYEYDADNRITDVLTGTDNVFFDRDASYFYYLHGPLKRMELGELKVQGLDYVYTLHGWIKGVNSSTLQEFRDPGRDGMPNLIHANVCRDVTAYNLSYYEGDFKAIGSNAGGTLNTTNYFTPAVTGTPLDAASPNLYNGNIRHMITALKPFMYNKTTGVWSSPQAMAYKYDQLNRIVSSQAMSGPNTQTGNSWSGAGTMPQYAETYTYDPNGNIMTLNRNGDNPSSPAMDQMSYNYQPGTNKLTHVQDLIAAGVYASDIDNQMPNNYQYDAIGNLIHDHAEEIDNIEWTVYGKIKKVTRTAASSKPDLEFGYSPDGHRIWKKVITKGASGYTKYTFYTQDAQGNQMAIYEYKRDSLLWESSPIYGSSRVGVYESQKLLYISTIPTGSTLAAGYNIAQRGIRRYEISNHLGNVLTTISDRRSMSTTTAGVIQYYEAEIVSASDYYPFGMVMGSRSFSVKGKYRYGFNGKESDSELANDNYDFGARIYDGRIGRWLAVDPLMKKHPNETPYSYVGNIVLICIDIAGKERIIICGGNSQAGAGSKLMFAEQGLRKLKEYSSSTETKTVVLVNINNSYTLEQINQITNDVIANGGNVVTVNSIEDLNMYINEKKTSTYTPMVNWIEQTRADDKISSIDIYSHGTCTEKTGSAFSFAYNCGDATVVSQGEYDKSDADKLSSSAFTTAATITSYACRTGAGAPASGAEGCAASSGDIFSDEFQNCLSSSSKSVAQKIADKTNTIVYAYLCRTDYSGTMGTTWDRKQLSPGWDDDYEIWNKNTITVDGASWNSKGAYRGVSGLPNNPIKGVAMQKFKFTKGKSATRGSD